MAAGCRNRLLEKYIYDADDEGLKKTDHGIQYSHEEERKDDEHPVRFDTLHVVPVLVGQERYKYLRTVERGYRDNIECCQKDVNVCNDAQRAIQKLDIIGDRQPVHQHCNEGKQEIGRHPRDGNQENALPEIPEIKVVHGHRLRPPKAKEKQCDRPERVEVPQGV